MFISARAQSTEMILGGQFGPQGFADLGDHLQEAAWGEEYVIGLAINFPVEGFARVDAVGPEELDQELYGSPFLGDGVADGPVFLGYLVFPTMPLPMSHKSGHAGDLGVMSSSLEV